MHFSTWCARAWRFTASIPKTNFDASQSWTFTPPLAWVATLPVGHADGWPRTAPKGAKVRIKDDLYPVIASVSASHCIVEIGGEERIKIGDVATFFDAQPGSRPEDISEACGASVYDLTMHLSPLLPRRFV